MYIYAYIICVCIYIFIFYIYICKGCMCVVPAWIDAKGFAQVRGCTYAHTDAYKYIHTLTITHHPSPQKPPPPWALGTPGKQLNS